MNIMNKIKKLQDELPENMESSHLSSNSRTSFQQYKISLKRDTNLVSHILLENAWQKHTQLFEGKVELVSQLVTSQLQGRNIEASKTWKSSLSKFSNSAELFTKNLPSCPSCSSNSVKYTGIKEFQRNCCKCDLGVKNINKDNVDARQCKGKSFFKTLSNCKENSDEVMSFEDKSTDLQPRFGRACKNLPKTVKPACNTTQSNFNEKEVEEENKLHQASVAKITFKTAKETLFASNPAAKRTLGATRKAQAKFVSPMIGAQDKQETADSVFNITDDRLKHLDPKMIELIENEIIDRGTPIAWDDIAGLQMAKSVIQEAVVWPLLRPDIFTGLRRPPKGILLFGPPGTGKTLIGKCIAAQCNATFFSISASSLTSKWIGDGEKMVRALFCVARCHQPAVIFIDEIDSLLTQRSDGEHEATRRIKTEFLVQLDGAATGEEDQLLIVGATNRPQELDEAARRRLVKRLYIPLPDMEARQQIIENLLHCEPNSLSPQDVAEVARLTDGFSGADMKSLCSEAAMGPVRAVPLAQIISIQRDKVRPVIAQDFMNALQRVRPSVSQEDLGQYVAWNNTYGHGF